MFLLYVAGKCYIFLKYFHYHQFCGFLYYIKGNLKSKTYDYLFQKKYYGL